MEVLLVAEHLGLVLGRPPGLGPARLQCVKHREGGLGVPPRPRVDVDVGASVDAADLRGEVAAGALGGAWTGIS